MPELIEKTRWTVAELYDSEFPEPRWIVPGLVPVGLTLFGGRPKAGKSLFMMNAAAAVGSGGYFMNTKIDQGLVLYLFLEDSPRVLRDRQSKMRIPRESLITWERNWKPLQKGGIDDILIELSSTDYRLIVIDTLTTSLPGVDHNKDGPILDRVLNDLHKLANDRNMGIVANDHTRKANGFMPDPIDDISGNTAKSRNADSVLALYVERGKKGAVLRGKGREVETFENQIHFDQETFCWQMDGDVSQIEITDQRQEILDALATLGKVQEPAIRKATGIEHAQLFRNLQALVKSGQISREEITGKVYYWKEDSADE